MFSFSLFPEIPRSFNKQFSCFSVSMLSGNEREDVERGGKIIMPPSALDHLTRLNISFPMLFKLTNVKTSRVTHCGVLEFIADEGKVYLPYWMMHNLLLEEGNLIQIENVSLPVATFSKFQPQSSDFLDITNPKAVLENSLRNFACLTTGDIIAINYNKKVYELCVLETQPGNAVTIIECDMNVEFASPVGYQEEKKERIKDEEMVIDPAELMPEPKGFVAFKCEGNRLDGKKKKKDDNTSSDSAATKITYQRGIPDYDYKIGTIQFFRHSRPKASDDPKRGDEDFKAFSGQGYSLRQSKARAL
ncbi:ubiquitin fusion-degradation 1-like [Lycorma delicatula]|uniref:ubiquitin fusion-degradation 1-like n=1 Tax=Lycorma delicatula TaxID=130591 RepID=UPI003F5133CE